MKTLVPYRFRDARSLLLAVQLLLCGGCQRGPLVRFSSPSELLAQLDKQSSCSRGVIGDAQLEFTGPFAHYKGKLLFKAEAPEQLRFDLYSDFGVSLATLATSKDQLSFFDLASNTLVQGKPSACSLARFTQVAIAPLALVELLRGRAPVVEHRVVDATLDWRAPWFGEGRYVVSFKGDHQVEETLWIEVPPVDWSRALSEQRVRLIRARVKQAGELLYSVRLSDYRPASRASLTPTQDEREMGILAYEPSGPSCEAELPHLISFDVGHVGHELKLQIHEMSHNPPRFSGSYTLQVPQSARIEKSSCD